MSNLFDTNKDIEELKNEIDKKDQEIAELKEKLRNLNSAIDYVINFIPKYDRLFNWKKVINHIKKIVNGYS